MSTLYVNTIYPRSGTTTAVSGNLYVSGTIDAYELRTIVETEYRGETTFGNDSNDIHQLTGSLHISGSGITLIGAQAGTALLTLTADQGDDVADNTTISVADGGNFTIDCANDIVFDADGAEIQFKDNGTTFAKASSASGFSVNAALSVSGSTTLGDAVGDITTISGPLSASVGATVEGALHVVGDADFSHGLSVSGSTTFAGATTFTTISASAGATVEGQLHVVGDADFSHGLNVSGSTTIKGAAVLSGSTTIGGSITPDDDVAYDLGSADKRFANIFTGDLHLKNERGDWTILEEADYLCVINNATGKKFKMMLQEIEE